MKISFFRAFFSGLRRGKSPWELNLANTEIREAIRKIISIFLSSFSANTVHCPNEKPFFVSSYRVISSFKRSSWPRNGWHYLSVLLDEQNSMRPLYVVLRTFMLKSYYRNILKCISSRNRSEHECFLKPPPFCLPIQLHF